jgi:lipopolysaccharide biosynthesis regulator YciM
MSDSVAAWLILPLGIALGWYIRGKGPAGSGNGISMPGAADDRPTAEAMAGMSSLVVDDPDQALAALLRVGEFDSQAIELHLTLGALFRKRGEVDRALRVHEALVERAPLRPDQFDRARYELALDYLKAGMIDHAEQLFEQLSQRGQYVTSALESLVAIHEQSHEWRRAIDASRRLQAVAAQPRQAITAQYYCELADEARRAKDYEEAQRLAWRALDQDGGCVRANLLLGSLLEQSGDRIGAIKALRLVPEQDLRYIPEIVEPLLRCSEAEHQLPEFLEFLQELDEEDTVSVSVLAQARLMKENGTNPARFLAESFAANPRWALLEQLLQVIEPPQDESMALAMNTLREALRIAAASRTRYRCTSCGLAPGLLFWQCPSCKTWGSVVPADDRLTPVKV